jgi:cation:H+ antiporter
MVWLWFIVVIISTIMIWKSSSWLEETSRKLSEHYGLPQVIQGAIIAAMGSSFPELSSVVISSLLHGDFNLGVASIVGSAVFNILVIPGLVSLNSGEMNLNSEIAHKEAKFYMVSVSALVIIFCMAVIYYPIEASDNIIKGRITPLLSVIAILLYCVYVFDQWESLKNSNIEEEISSNILKNWIMLFVSLILIAVSVEGLLRAVLFFGDYFGTPSFLWGITVVAAGTSLPDALVSIRQAENENDVASVSNVFGSNVFDLLVAIPIGVILSGGAVINFSASIPLMGFLVSATVLVFIFVRTNFNLSDREGMTLIIVYLLFVIWIFLETFNILSFIPGA